MYVTDIFLSQAQSNDAVRISISLFCSAISDKMEQPESEKGTQKLKTAKLNTTKTTTFGNSSNVHDAQTFIGIHYINCVPRFTI